jgi:Fic family protein
MNTETLHRESHQIIQTLRTYSPLGIDELISKSRITISKATVLRRLDELMQLQWVERVGKTRGTRYYLTEKGREQPTSQWNALYLKQPSPPISFDGYLRETPPYEDPDDDDRLRAAIRRPVNQRLPVGYHREFLSDYRPNLTYYLPEELREELRQAGQSDQMANLPVGTYVRNVFQRVLIDLSWNSSRLEGNTYSLLETERLLEMGREADPTRFLEARMILNHKEAIEFLIEAQDDVGFNRFTILNLHAMLARGLLHDQMSEGRLRRMAVGIGGSVYSPLDVPQLIEECFVEILEKADAIKDPLEQAFFAMVHLPYLQAFDDVNKRVSRLAANIPLIRENMAPISFTGVPVKDYTDAILAVYELNRVDLLRDLFAKAYRLSAAKYAAVCQTTSQPDPVGMKYHEELKQVVREVVLSPMNKTEAAQHVRRWAMDHVAPADRSRATEMAENDLLALHEGNFARLRVRPSEFAAWQAIWQRRAQPY